LFESYSSNHNDVTYVLVSLARERPKKVSCADFVSLDKVIGAK
jgi:hypothetical protein